jgi:hypothetical protein
VVAACDDGQPDAGPTDAADSVDASAADASPPDASSPDASPPDASPPDAGPAVNTCNPLTQIRDDGAPACGSANPAMPDLGCYPAQGPDFTSFECAPAGTLGHRDVVTPPIYINACLPGAIPMLYESSGSMQVVCIAMCAPLRINNTEPDEARDGAEPHSCPEMPPGVGVVGPVARATGPFERCQHLWWWSSIDTAPHPLWNAYGVCVDFTKYTWDADQNPATPPVPWTLPETTDPYVDLMNPMPTEDLFWGTAPYPIPLTGAYAPRAHTARDLGFRPLQRPR